MRLSGKVAIVTGGGGDIGRATAQRFAAEGAKVMIADVSETDGQRTVDVLTEQGAEAAFICTDMTNPEDVERMADRTQEVFGHVDIFYNSAGINADEKKIPDVTLAEWQKVMDININGVFLGMKYMLPKMESGGAVVNTASIAGIKGQKLVAAYSASKSSVIAITKTAATEFGRKNIRVNTVAPGIIDTKMVDDWKQTDKWPVLSTANALRRTGKAEEVAKAVLFLASDEASFITGETLVVDGGTLNM